MVLQIARPPRLAMPFEISGRADHPSPHRAQPPRDQAGIRQIGDAQRDVDAAGNQIDPAIVKLQIDRHLGIGGQELRQAGAMWRNPNDIGAASRTRPRGTAELAWASASAASPSARIRAARTASTRPASVSAKRRDVRWISRSPSRASSRCTAFDTVAPDRPSSTAAAANEPVSATLAKSPRLRGRGGAGKPPEWKR